MAAQTGTTGKGVMIIQGTTWMVQTVCSKNVLTRNLMQCKGLGTLSVVVWHGHSLMFKNAAWQVSNKSIPVVTNVCLVEVEQLCLEQWHTVGFQPINVQLKRFLFLLPVVSHTTEV